MGGDGRNVKSSGEIPPSGIHAYCREDRLVCGGQGVVMDPSGRRPIDSKSMAHQVVHSAEAGHHWGSHCLPSYILAVQGGQRIFWGLVDSLGGGTRTRGVR